MTSVLIALFANALRCIYRILTFYSGVGALSRKMCLGTGEDGCVSAFDSVEFLPGTMRILGG